jgi:diguanylate cyclase (GGDEF)-like protein
MRRVKLIPAALEWLTRPLNPAHEEIRASLIYHLRARFETLVFGGISLSVVCLVYALTYDFRVGMALLVAEGGLTIWRFFALRKAVATRERIGGVVVTGLIWAFVAGLIVAVCSFAGEIYLVALGSMVGTGIAFGCAFGNSGMPRVAGIQVVLMTVPFAASAALSHEPYMALVALQTPLWLAGIFVIITQTHRTNAKLILAEKRNRYLAFNDPLTGLANRANIMSSLEDISASLAGGRRQSAYLLYLDLDGFKSINDRYGHRVGDDFLRVAATRFRGALRQNDLIGRIGGDEFIAILYDVSFPQIEMVVQRLVHAAAQPFELEGLGVTQIGVSVGGAPLMSEDDFKAALEVADCMLYAAKQSGKGTYRLSKMSAVAAEISMNSPTAASPARRQRAG